MPLIGLRSCQLVEGFRYFYGLTQPTIVHVHTQERNVGIEMCAKTFSLELVGWFAPIQRPTMPNNGQICADQQ